MKVRAWLINEGPKWLIIIIWLIINLILFLTTFNYYHYNQKFFYTRVLLGTSLAWARGSAILLNFNSLLILLPMCRKLISFLRGSCSCCKRIVRRQLDHHLLFHKLIAYMICLQTVIHIIAHCYNFEKFLHTHEPNNSVLASILTNLPFNATSGVNPIRTNGNSPVAVQEMFKTVAGATGVIITLSLVLIFTSATEVIRRSYFEVFWFTHHLFIVFFLGLVFHGVQGIIHGQTNLDENNPGICSKDVINWPTTECQIPKFAGAEPNSWKWVIASVIVYLVERGIQFFRSMQKITITKVIKHPSQVLEIQMKKLGFSMEVGQYIYLHCRSISYLEWHPFTLTSAPEDDFFSVHIRVVGDWTKALAQSFGMDNLEQTEKLPSIAVDGPFGTASGDIFRYQVAVLIASGIGVTPFASALKSIWYKYFNDDPLLKLKKVYFFWICPDMHSFEWFNDLLHLLEAQMAERQQSDFIEFNIFLTRGWTKDQAINIAIHSSEAQDVITGLRQKTQFGRPKWENVFSKIAETHSGISTGVFFCGPSSLSKVLANMCNQYSSSEPTGIQFHYNKENF